MFEMPDEVIWEISNPNNIEGNLDHPYAPEATVKCKTCGYSGLVWVRTNGKWGLQYAHGKLKGKLHACPAT